MLSEEKLKQIGSKYKRRYDPKTGKEIIGVESEKNFENEKAEEIEREEKQEKVSEGLEQPDVSSEDQDDSDELSDENSPFYEGNDSVLENDIEEDAIIDDDYEEENENEEVHNLDNEPDFSSNDGYDDYNNSLEDEYGDEFSYLMDESGGNENEENEEEVEEIDEKTDEKSSKKEEEKDKKESESVKRSQEDVKSDEKEKVGLKEFSEDVKEEVKNTKTNYNSFSDYEKPKTVNIVTNYVDYEGSIKKHEEFVNKVKDNSKSKQKSITKIPESIAKIIEKSIKTNRDKGSLALKLTVFVLLYTDIDIEEINMMETDLVSRKDVEESLKLNSKASKYAETLSLVNNIDANTFRTRIDQEKFMRETDVKLILIMSIVMAMIHDSYGLRKGEYPSSVDDLDFHSKQLSYMFENLYKQYPEIKKMIEEEARK